MSEVRDVTDAGAAAAGGADAADLRVSIGAPTGVDVAPDLWGLFLEDINTALDGGLNAEMVRNGDFEFGPHDHAGWHALTGWRIDPPAAVGLRHEAPVHPNNATYVRAVGPVTLDNDGWEGMPVAAGDRFRFTAATWRVFGSGALAVQLVDGDRVLGRVDVDLPERGWHHVEATLATSESGRGSLRLVVPDGLTVELDVISLRPLDENGAPRTFRPDLVEALRALAPSFVRFPGGCVAHGLGLANMYTWKPTIGARHEREQIPNLWGYHQSRQIGYLEFFELCETLGASPMPILAAGVCCQNTRGGAHAIPQADMPAYVQDVLDLIEFANGGADTVWGARRAELGHPEPFGLRYLGVGNEDAITDDFRDRYAQIEDAVRAAHPEITVIGTVGPFPFGHDWEQGWQFARERHVAIVDEHAYRTPRWFHQNVDRYASYRRDESKVYFGEYAARTSTLRSALAEAAFMAGMERNSDVVALASYAPLLSRIGHTQWEPDLIYFDAEQVLPTPSYHVQRMFAQQRGTRLHAVALAGADPVPVAVPTSGSLRWTSPGAAFMLSQITVDGRTLPDVHTTPDGAVVTVAEIDPTAAEISFTATRTSGDRALATQLGGIGRESFIEHALPNWTGLESVVNRSDDGITNDDDGPVPWHSLSTGVPVAVRIVLAGARVRIDVDGVTLHDYEQDLRPEHRIVATAAARTVAPDASPAAAPATTDEFVVRLVNATATARDTRIDHAGRAVAGVGDLLCGADPDLVVPRDQPAPVEVRDISLAADDALLLPPWSAAVLVLRDV